jgi:lipoate---protein ligase
MQTKTFRVIDTGVRDGRRQIAFDQALIEAHKAGSIPDTIRFLRFPPTALIGRHQALSSEIKLDYCSAHGIGRSISTRASSAGSLSSTAKRSRSARSPS